MKSSKILIVLLLVVVQQLSAQQKSNDEEQISAVIEKYSEAVIKKDSVVFYGLFNDDNVTWCASVTDKSQRKEIEAKGLKESARGYFTGSYKGFMRSLFRYKSTEDKFDNIRIIEDGTVASVTMDYSFWAESKMTNFGSKFLGLIKKDGQWRITSVIYSLELTQYFEQPPLKKRVEGNG